MKDNILRVSSQSNPASVAGALAGLLREVDKVELRAIGAGAVNQAVKSIAVARGYVATQGMNLVCIPAFGECEVEDTERSMMRLIVKSEV